jgi:hypothetical protein
MRILNVLFVVGGSILSGCMAPTVQEESTGLTLRETIPSVNAWIVSQGSLHHVRVLVQDERYYKPGLSLLQYGNHAGVSVATAPPIFMVYAQYDKGLYKFRESCAFGDSVYFENGVRFLQSKRRISPDSGVAAYLPEPCEAVASLDTALARNIVLPGPYMIDSVFGLNGNGVPYLEEITVFYVERQEIGGSREQITDAIYYNATVGGIIFVPFYDSPSLALGRFEVFY